MSDLRTAAQQALEALCLWATGRDMDAVALNDLILRLEAALAEPVQEPDTDCHLQGICQRSGYSLLAQPVQEPVAWMVYTEGGASAYVTDNPRDLIGAYRALPLYTSPPQPAAPIIKTEIKDDKPVPPPEAQTEAEKISYCAGWWAALEAERKELLRIAEKP